MINDIHDECRRIKQKHNSNILCLPPHSVSRTTKCMYEIFFTLLAFFERFVGSHGWPVFSYVCLRYIIIQIDAYFVCRKKCFFVARASSSLLREIGVCTLLCEIAALFSLSSRLKSVSFKSVFDWEGKAVFLRNRNISSPPSFLFAKLTVEDLVLKGQIVAA